MLGGVGDAARVARYADPMREPGALTAALNWYRAMSAGRHDGRRPGRGAHHVRLERPGHRDRPDRRRGLRDHVTGDYRFVELAGVTHWIPDEAPGPLAEAILARAAGDRDDRRAGARAAHPRRRSPRSSTTSAYAPAVVLLVHAALRPLGFVCGGPQAVVRALRDVLGPDGTLVVPTHTPDNSDPAGWRNPPVPADWWPVIRARCPASTRRVTPSRFMGALAETVRTWPGALRSDHPHVSFAALGPAAERIVAGHRLADMLGEGSPLARLYDLDADVLLLGVGPRLEHLAAPGRVPPAGAAPGAAWAPPCAPATAAGSGCGGTDVGSTRATSTGSAPTWRPPARSVGTGRRRDGPADAPAGGGRLRGGAGWPATDGRRNA